MNPAYRGERCDAPAERMVQGRPLLKSGMRAKYQPDGLLREPMLDGVANQIRVVLEFELLEDTDAVGADRVGA